MSAGVSAGIGAYIRTAVGAGAGAAVSAPPPRSESSFNLLRRFGLVSLAVIVTIAVASSLLLSDFVTEQFLHREARVTVEFVTHTLVADESIGFFEKPGDAELARRFGVSVAYLRSMAEVQRVNVYSRERAVLWSTDPSLVGQRFSRNDELERALGGALVVEGGSISDTQRRKAEHAGMSAQSTFFVETYMPVRVPGQSEVIGVIELYRTPEALTAAITQGHRHIWLSAGLGALALYLTLFWIVYGADRRIRHQNERLVKAETMAAVGELAASVAHNIRNPLASIRSSAELATAVSCSLPCEQMRDIMVSVDRIELWLRDLVNLGHADPSPYASVDAAQLLRECFERGADEFRRRGIEARVEAGALPVNVKVDRALLGHVLQSLVNNAIEATAPGGRVTGEVTTKNGRVEIRTADTGCGIAPEHLSRLFGLFFTTKPRGLGIGLSLARRAVERFGGTIRAESAVGLGTALIIEMPGAQ